jgi:hypothetical protein
MKKVEAAMDVAEYLGLAHGNTEIILHDEYVTAGTVLSGVVMTGVDSIAARRVIWEAVQNNLVDVPLLIDGRMAGEYAQVLTLCPTDFEFAEVYEDEWLTEGGTIPNLCGTRVTAYVCARVASDMVWSLTRFSRGLPMRFDSSVDFRFI